MLGKEVATLLNKEQPVGKYEVEFNADDYNLSSGVYFLRLEAYKNNSLEFSASKKVTLIK